MIEDHRLRRYPMICSSGGTLHEANNCSTAARSVGEHEPPWVCPGGDVAHEPPLEVTLGASRHEQPQRGKRVWPDIKGPLLPKRRHGGKASPRDRAPPSREADRGTAFLSADDPRE